MKSEHRDYLAAEWSKGKRQDYIRGCVLGLLKEGGVIKGSMDSIARSANVCDNYRTFSRYMGQCRQEPFAEWILNSQNALATHVDKEDKSTAPIQGTAYETRVTLINESGLYALILSSKLPQAKAYSIAFPKSTPLNVNKKKKFPKKQ